MTAHIRRSRWMRTLTALAAVLGAAAASLTSHDGASTAAAAPSVPVSGFSFATTPGLYPTFDPAITDYVTRCASGSSTSIDVIVPAGAEAAVNGAPGSSTSFSTSVPLAPNASFSVTVLQLDGSGSTTYFVRCLPSDFPSFSSSTPGTPQAEYYVVAPLYPGFIGGPTQTQYTAIFDTHGVPLWWRPANSKFVLGTLLPNRDLANVFVSPRTAIESRLTGGVTRTLTVPGGIDEHELELQPDGTYLLAALATKAADETFLGCGAPADATVDDQILQEVTPNGTVVWSWDPYEHIPVTDTDPQFFANLCANGDQGGKGYDNYHFNSADDDGSTVLVSFRNLDAVYAIDKATGNILWKLGGSTTPQSLSFVDDPYGTFGGQHDARFSSDGGITVHDNGTGRGRAPRAARYAIDLDARTATLVEQVTDPLVTSSVCCGGARKLPGGDWVVSWGFSNVVTELAPGPAATRQFLLQWDPGWFSYRALPVLPGTLSRAALRSDMISQFH